MWQKSHQSQSLSHKFSLAANTTRSAAPERAPHRLQCSFSGRIRQTNSHIPTIKNYRFDYPKTRATFVVTYVAGHLTELDFTPEFKSWQACDPFQLFDAQTMVEYPGRSKDFIRNLQTQARNAHKLMIWTDCDREGEHIGSEIVTVCRKFNTRISVERARFSAIIPQ